MAALVSFTIRIMVGFPRGEPDNTRVAQGSAFGLVVGGTAVNVTASVGVTIEVSVGTGVCVGVSVGGMGVAVGRAACVCATSVKAAASAVCCTSAPLMVGTGCAPQALTRNRMALRSAVTLVCFMMGYRLQLTMWVTLTCSCDLIVSDDDLPTTFRDPEITEHFETLFAIHEGAGAVHSFRSLRQVGQIPALASLCYNIQREHNLAFRLGLIDDGQVCRWTIPFRERFVAQVQ